MQNNKNAEAVKIIDELMMKECEGWFGDDAEIKDHVSTLHSFDEGEYHQRIYLVAYSDDDGYAHYSVIRVFTGDNGKNIGLSEDYEGCVRYTDFINEIPTIIKNANKFKDC